MKVENYLKIPKVKKNHRIYIFFFICSISKKKIVYQGFQLNCTQKASSKVAIEYILHQIQPKLFKMNKVLKYSRNLLNSTSFRK